MAVGDIDTRTAIQARHGGSQARGISAPAVNLGAGDIMLWWRPSHGERYGYADGWAADGVFYFTGTGQFGDQRFEAPNAENGRVRDHRLRKDRLRLLRYLRANQVRYVGEFELDPDNPWQWRDGPDLLGRTRKMIQFRMLPVGLVEAVADEPTRETREETAVESVAPVPTEPEITALEALKKAQFQRLVQAREQVSRREELQLVHTFRDWLVSYQGLDSSGLRIRVADGLPPLRADLFIPARGVLVEAKASASREHLRTAIGQLLDYARYLDPPAHMCVLTPTRPADDMMWLLQHLKIAAVWPESGSFAWAPAGFFIAP